MISGRKCLHGVMMVALFIALSSGLYFTTLHHEFHFDDYVYVLQTNETVSIEDILGGLRYHLFRPDRHLVTLSFAINHVIHREAVAGYHLVNILLHGLNGALLYYLLASMRAAVSSATSSGAAFRIDVHALFAAAFFLLHPVAVNTVAYVTQRHGLMATLFYLLTCLCYVRLRTTRSGILGTAAWLTGLVVSFWGAIHSKPMTVTLPLALVVIELALFTRISRRTWKAIVKWLLLVLVLFLLLLLKFAVVTGLFSANAALAGFTSEHLWSPWQHMMTESVVFLHYWKILLLPLDRWICIDHLFPVITELNSTVIASWIVHGCIIGGVVSLFARGQRIMAIGGAWFYITLVPPYLALPILDVMVDYKTYLPSIGLAMVIYAFVGWLHREGRGRYLSVGAMLVLVLLCFGSVQRIASFSSEIRLWSDVLAKYPENARALNNRGLAYSRMNDHQSALMDFTRAIELDDRFGLAHANLGDSYLKLGQPERALHHYQQYARIRPDDPNGYVRLANLVARSGDWQQATEIYRQGIEVDPQHIGLQYNLGLAYAHTGDFTKTIQLLEKVVSKQPTHVEAWNTLGSAYYSEGDGERAISCYLRVLSVAPDHAGSIYNLAVAYIEKNDSKRADIFIKRLEKLAPDKVRILRKHLRHIGVNG